MAHPTISSLPEIEGATIVSVVMVQSHSLDEKFPVEFNVIITTDRGVHVVYGVSNNNLTIKKEIITDLATGEERCLP